MNVKNIFYRRDGKEIYIKTPDFEELEYTRKLWADHDSMVDVGKVVEFPKIQWKSFYKKMINPTDGKNLYCLVYTYDNIPVGEASFHGYDSATKTARFNIRIEESKRKKGYGTEAARLILEFYFQEFGGELIVDTVKDDKSRYALEKFGFKFINRNRDQFVYRMSKEEFLINAPLNKKSIGIVVYNGVDTLNVILAISIFSKINEIMGEEIFSINIIGETKGYINTLKDIRIDINKTFNESVEESYDIIVLPPTNNEEKIMSLEFTKFLESASKKCDMIIASEEGIIPLMKVGGVRGLKITINDIYKDKYKDLIAQSLLSDKNIIDNGRIIIFKGFENCMNGYLYTIKRLCGEHIYEKLLSI